MPSQSHSRFIDVPALLVEARFRGVPLASRLLRADGRSGFAVGAARGADAPVDVGFIEATPGNDNHVLVQPSGAGFLINLSAAMRAGLEGTAAHLRVPCGEVVFDISAAASAPAVARPWLSSRARDLAPYVAGVAVAMTLLLVILQMVPADARALSLDDLGRTVRFDFYRINPAVTPPPPPSVGGGVATGGSAPVAPSGPTGVAGDHRARPAHGPRATKGPASTPQDARDIEEYVRANTMLAVLDGPRGQALTQVLATTAALGSDAATVLAHLQGQTLADAYGIGLGPTGTGKGGADTGRVMIGGAPGLTTIGRNGGKSGDERRYGDREGMLPHRDRHELKIETQPAVVRGRLDKEIVRRVVRKHLNEVRYCYEQSLVRRPSLAGRVVANFTIAPTGRVLASVLQSSTLGEGAVESCIVSAIRRWEFPAPDGGGLVVVSYPFQLAPAGG